MNLSSNFSVKVVIPAAGGDTVLVGSGAADGTFSVPNVPTGSFILVVDSSVDNDPPLYLYTAQRSGIEIGRYYMGRSDATLTTDPSWIAFNPAVTNLTAWGTDDQLQMMVANNGGFGDLTYTTIQNPPAVGATTLGMTFNWDDVWERYAIDASKGDDAYITQLVPRSNGSGLPHFTIDKVFQPALFSLANGQTVNITGAFSAVPQNLSDTINWRRSQFDSYKTAINPTATLYDQYLEVRTQPGGLGFGHFGATTSDLIQFMPGPGTSDLNLGTVAFGDPFPSSWGRVGTAQALYSVPVQALGATSGGQLYNVIQFEDDVNHFGPNVSPVISPPRSIQVNGSSAFSTGTLVGGDNTISWQAPQIGTPSGYGIYVWQLGVNGSGGTTFHFQAEVVTTTNSVTLPAGFFVAGSSYAFMVRSITLPSLVRLDKEPHRLGLPYGVADATTAVFGN
jgi:hypothetical protein